MEDREKYTLDERDADVDLSDHYVRPVEDVRATVTDVSLPRREVKRIKPNGECSVKPPRVRVTFSIGESDVRRLFFLDPFVTEGDTDVLSNVELFGRLLASAGVAWSDLPELIGSTVPIKRPSMSTRIQLDTDVEPLAYANLAALDWKELTHERIDRRVSRLLVQHVRNRTVGEGTIVDVTAETYAVHVTVELPSGHTFLRKFPIRQPESDTSVLTQLDPWLETDTTYTFWDFTEDAVGYVPDEGKYDVLFGRTVSVEYVSGEWIIGPELVE